MHGLQRHNYHVSTKNLEWFVIGWKSVILIKYTSKSFKHIAEVSNLFQFISMRSWSSVQIWIRFNQYHAVEIVSDTINLLVQCSVCDC